MVVHKGHMKDVASHLSPSELWKEPALGHEADPGSSSVLVFYQMLDAGQAIYLSCEVSDFLYFNSLLECFFLI